MCKRTQETTKRCTERNTKFVERLTEDNKKITHLNTRQRVFKDERRQQNRQVPKEVTAVNLADHPHDIKIKKEYIPLEKRYVSLNIIPSVTCPLHNQISLLFHFLCIRMYK